MANPLADVMAMNTKRGEGKPSHTKAGHLLKDQLELVKQKTPDGKTRYSIKPLATELSFDKGLFVFVRAVQLLTSQNKDVIVVGLAGPSGAGKTVFGKKILNLIPGCAMLSMDNYNDGSKVIDGNFDDPRITDYDTLLANIRDLKEGRTTQVPIYDFKESARVGYRTVEVPESRVVILEGIYALSHRLCPMLDLRVSITGGVHFDLVKRVLRDIDRSGQAPEDIIQQVSDTVYPMYKAFIEPDLKAAHLRITNTFNPFSGFMSPTYILKAAKEITQEQAAAVLAPDHVKHTESETYDIYLVPPGEDPETCQSWLRMRYRDGRYNLMFEEWMVEGHFIISPRVTFEVPVRILGGLMALGYEIGTIMRRHTEAFADDKLVVKIDTVKGMDRSFVQIQGKNRAAVAQAAEKLGLEGHYIPHSYIELVQLENLMTSFQEVTEDLKRRFAVNGEPLINDDSVVGSFSRGSSPHFGSFNRTTGFSIQSPKSTASGGGRGNYNGGNGNGNGSNNGESVLPLLSTSAPVAGLGGLQRPPSSSAIAVAQRGGLLSQRISEAAAAATASATGNGSHPIPTPNANGMVLGANGIGFPGHYSSAASSETHSDRGGNGNGVAGGSSRKGQGSRPPSPEGAIAVDTQLRRLMAGQTALSDRVEELALAMNRSDLAVRQKVAQQDALLQQVAVASVVTPGVWFSVGIVAGSVSALLLSRLLGGR